MKDIAFAAVITVGIFFVLTVLMNVACAVIGAAILAIVFGVQAIRRGREAQIER
jgi:hypothetical protein